MDKVLEEWYKLHRFYLYSGTYETKDLSKFLGISPRTIQRWLKGQIKPKEKYLKMLSAYLNEKKNVS